MEWAPVPHAPPALQMTNAPDAQLGFPAPRRVFTLMASIGSKTHGNRECSPENGQEGPPAGSASQGKAGAAIEFPERILVRGGRRSNWRGAFKSTGARCGSGVPGGSGRIAYGVPARRRPPQFLTPGFDGSSLAGSRCRQSPEDHDQCSSRRNEMSNPA